ncbi:MAG: SH3 domain-containing protein [Cyclobacteriaceae bacterium]
MKYLNFLILFLTFTQLSAQDSGIINDPDGYTNVRKGEGTNFEVVGKIEESDQFLYYPNENSSWWKVKTTPAYGRSIEGFVHKSRIQPYYMESPNCNCPSDYGMNGSRTILLANLENSTLAVCGYLLQRTEDNSIKASEFTISNCATNEVLRFYGAVTTCYVRSTGKSLEIIELDRLPLGKGFQWIQTPYRKVVLSDVSGTPTFGDEKFVLDLSNITDSDIASFVSELPNYKGQGYFDEIETFIGKLLICSLKGNKQCEAVFNDINNYLNFVLDGAFKEFYNDCKTVLNESKSR